MVENKKHICRAAKKTAAKTAQAFFAVAALCAIFGAALFSCSFFEADSSSEVGSITVSLPSAEKINAASGSVLRAVSSFGSISDRDVKSFKVRTRNAATGAETVQSVAPGSTVNISPLVPGLWTVTVFGNNAAGQTLYYGKTSDIFVSAGQTTPATVVINSVNPNTPLVASLENAQSLPAEGRANVASAYVSLSAGRKTSSAFYDFSDADAANQPQEADKIIVPVPAFLEPGSSASAKVFLFGSNGAALWSGTVSGKVKSDGTLEGFLAFMETSLVGTQTSGAVPPADYAKIESALAAQMETDLLYSFEAIQAGAASGEAKNYDELKITALLSDACGNVPVLAEYGELAWAKAISFKHKYVEPTVTMSDQAIPLGVTRTLAAEVKSNAAKDYSVCGSAQSYDDYGFKIYSIQGEDTGAVISAASFAPPPNQVCTEFTSPDKVKATGAGSDDYSWVVTVTKSAWAYFEGDDSQASKTLSGTFSASGSDWTITPNSVSVERGSAFTLTLSCDDATEADAKSVTKVSLNAVSAKDFVPTVSGTSLVVNAEDFATWTGADPKKVFVSVEGVDAGMIEVTATAPSGGGGSGGNVPADPDWFSFQSTAEVLPEGTVGENDKLSPHLKANPAARYVYFGNYPRSRIANGVTVDDSDTAEKHTFGNYTYYKGSDGEWYAKHKVKGNSGYYASATPGARGNAVDNAGTVAYFKLEPIKWRVLTTNYNNTGYALLITDESIPGYFDYDADISEHKRFSYTNHVRDDRTIGGKTIGISNYQYSNARAWLNGLNGSSYGMQNWTDAGFINSAFTEAARMKIKEVVVDNSAASCYQPHETVGTTYNAYLSENTTDKIFLLSIREVTTPLWGFDEATDQYGTRCFVPTDLAIASGVYRETASDGIYYGCWCYLRTPSGSGSEQTCSGIGYAGNGETAYNDYNNAMVPAICVDLSDLGGAAIGDVGLPNSNVDSHYALPGLFTVNDSGKQVKFSLGNLEWTNKTGSTVYHFAQRQSFYCRNTRGNKYHIDLMSYSNVSSANSSGIAESDLTNWRVLTDDEWQYLLGTRSGAASKVGVAQVIGLEGLVILPDNWTLPAGLTFNSGFASDSQEYKDVNQYTAMQWDKMEKAGAVFLPACGLTTYNSGTYIRTSNTLRVYGGYLTGSGTFMQFSKSEITYQTGDSYEFHNIRLVVDDN